MQSEAKTVLEYLNSLPEDRKQQISQVRDVILKNLPAGIEEVMNWGMITYQVPFTIFPNTYNNQPLMFAALASQKNYMAVYLSGIYSSKELREKFISRYKSTRKKMDMGKSCVRFRKIEDLPLDLIGEAIAALGVDEFIEIYNNSRKRTSAK